MNNVRQPNERGRSEGEAPRSFGWALGFVGVLLLALSVAFTALGTPAAAPTRPPTGETTPGGPATSFGTSLSVQPIHWPDGAAYVFVLGVMADDAPLSLSFSSGQRYDFVVRQEGREVWRWSADKAFHQAFNELQLEPGRLTTFVAVWDGRDFRGEPVAGDVEVQAWITSSPPVKAEPTIVSVDNF